MITIITFRIQSFDGEAGWVPWVGVYTTEKDVRRKLRDVLDDGVWKAAELRLVKITTLETTEILP